MSDINDAIAQSWAAWPTAPSHEYHFCVVSQANTTRCVHLKIGRWYTPERGHHGNGFVIQVNGVRIFSDNVVECSQHNASDLCVLPRATTIFLHGRRPNAIENHGENDFHYIPDWSNVPISKALVQQTMDTIMVHKTGALHVICAAHGVQMNCNYCTNPMTLAYTRVCLEAVCLHCHEKYQFANPQ